MYRLYDCDLLSIKVKKQLEMWNDKMNVDQVSVDPIGMHKSNICRQAEIHDGRYLY
eukprot:m.97193 g.97193  ORF g.97193 m.97193 type:complete len:56 (+) comp36937_c0_seq1:1476-1643(+)